MSLTCLFTSITKEYPYDLYSGRNTSNRCPMGMVDAREETTHLITTTQTSGGPTMTTKITFKGGTDEEAVKRRKELGRWLRAARVALGWTQLEAAKRLGYEWYTFISQVEGGHARIPTEAWEHWARVYELPVEEFCTRVLKTYDPSLLKIVKRLTGG